MKAASHLISLPACLRRPAALLLLAAPLFAGCATSGTGTGPPAQDEQLERVREMAERRERGAGTGSVSWKTRRRNVSANGVMLLDWDGRKLRLEVQDPIGGMIALIVLDDDRFWSYVEEEGEAVTGPMDHPDVRKVLPLPLSTEDYLRVLLARPRFADLDFKYGKKPNSALLHYPGDERRDYVEWDPATEQPLRWHIRWRNRRYIEVEYSDYEPVLGVPFPNTIRIHYAYGRRSILRMTWRWRGLEGYIPEGSQAFRIPPKWAGEVRTRTLQ